MSYGVVGSGDGFLVVVVCSWVNYIKLWSIEQHKTILAHVVVTTYYFSQDLTW